MTISELCREAVGAIIASHYNPHWTIVACRWVMANVAALILTVRSRF
jgi:hypothetical protein